MYPVNLGPYLEPGIENVLAMDPDGSSLAYFQGRVVLDDGSEIVLDTGPGWKVNMASPSGWKGAEFDDSSWAAAAGGKPKRGHHHLDRRWPVYDGRVLLENPGPDPLLYYDDAAPVEVRARIPGSWSGARPDLQWIMRSVGRENVRPRLARGTVSAAQASLRDGSLVYAVDAGRREQGVYTLEVSLSADGDTVEHRFEEPLIVVGTLAMKEVPGDEYEQGMGLELEDVIDFTDPGDPHPWIEVQAPPCAKARDPFLFDYSDATIARFEAETGIHTPGERGAPERFELRHLFLTSEAMRETWIEWRCRNMGSYLTKTRDVLRGYRRDLNVLCGWHLTRLPVRHWLTQSGTGYGEYMRQLGMNPAAVRDAPGIWFGRTLYPVGSSHHGNRAYMWAHHVDPGAIAYYDVSNRMVVLNTCWSELTARPGARDDWPMGRSYTARFISQGHGDNALESFTQAMIGADPDIPIELKPYGLTAFTVEAAHIEVESWRNDALPESELAHMHGIVGAVRDLLSDRGTALAIPRTDRDYLLAVCRAAETMLKQDRYAAAWSALTHWRFWELWKQVLVPAGTHSARLAGRPDQATLVPQQRPVLGVARVEGRPDDAAWQDARPSFRFLSLGSSASLSLGFPLMDMAVQAAYDEEALYVRLRMADPDVEALKSTASRDNPIEVLRKYDDTVEKLLDGNGGTRRGGGLDEHSRPRGSA